MKKQGFLQCSAILIISVIVSKAVGALFRIPLANLIGGVGMGYFGGAYGLFLPIYAVFVTGLSSASARLMAESSVLYGASGEKAVKKYSLRSFGVVGVIGTVVIIVLARPFCMYIIESQQVYISVIAIAPSVFFSCITAAYRGCREGQRNMYPTAVSQIAEGITKLVCGLVFCIVVLKNPDYFLKLSEGICDDIYALASAAAVLGVTLSSFMGMLYMIADDIFAKRKISSDYFGCKLPPSREFVKSLVKIAVPVAVSSLLTNLTSLVDLATIMKCVNRSVAKSPGYYLQRYSFIGEIGEENFASFVYGSFNGLAITIFNLVPSVTNMFGKSVLPAVTDAWTQKDSSCLEKNIRDALRATAVIAVPAGLGMCVTAKEILTFLFPTSCNEVTLASESLVFLAPAVIFLSVSYPMFCILQAIGKENCPVKIMLVGVIVKIAGNICFIGVPKLNAAGAALSTLICYVVIFVLSFAYVKRYTGLKDGVFRIFAGPFHSGLLCMASAWVCRCTVMRITDNNTVILMSSVFAGGVIYIFSLWLMNIQLKKNFLSDSNKRNYYIH